MTTSIFVSDSRENNRVEVGRMTRDEIIELVADAIGTHPKMQEALLHWITFNPYIECKE